MPKKLVKLYHKYNEQLAKYRRANVGRHAGDENGLKLEQDGQRFLRNATYDMELRRLRGATSQGHIAPHAHKRVADLKNILGK